MSETRVALLVAYGFTLVRNGTYRQQQAGSRWCELGSRSVWSAVCRIDLIYCAHKKKEQHWSERQTQERDMQTAGR